MYRLLILFVLIFNSQVVLANTTSLESALATFYGAKDEADYDRALELFENLYEKNPKNAEIAFNYGRSLYREQRLEEADEVLSANIKRYPDHVESHYVLGSVKLTRVSQVSLFRKIGMAKDAIAAWEKTVELEPEHVEALYGVVEFYLNAPGMAGGNKEVGQAKLKELEGLSKPWADLSKASMALRDEAFDKSQTYFASAISGIPGRAFPQLMLANAYLRQEKFDDAKAALEIYKDRARTWNDPGIAQIELMAAKIYQGLKQNEKAARAAQVVLDNNPPDNIRKQAEEILEAI